MYLYCWKLVSGCQFKICYIIDKFAILLINLLYYWLIWEKLYYFWYSSCAKDNSIRGRREQTTSSNCTKVSQMSKCWNLVTIIWDHHQKCIQISTNILGIGLEYFEISRILRNQTILYEWWNQWPREIQSKLTYILKINLSVKVVGCRCFHNQSSVKVSDIGDSNRRWLNASWVSRLFDGSVSFSKTW